MNAKIEILNLFNGLPDIMCADIEYDDKHITLPITHTTERLLKFLDHLDFDYDNFFDGFQLTGIVWLKDGTFLARKTIGISEWWEHVKTPEIPNHLR